MNKLTSAPSFCYIAPTSYIRTIEPFSTVHLVLAHLVDHDDVYASEYLRLSQLGHKIMMDNSAYELKVPYAPQRLVELAKKCGAHAVVLPDYPFQPSRHTIEAAEEFAPIFKAEGLMTFFVPQSKKGETEDWITGYKWAASHPDIDIIGHSILGVPNALPHIDPSYARVVMTQLLIDRGIFAHGKHNHYLGLNAGPKLEIPSLLRMKALDTIDSSGPVWCAILGHEYSANTDSYLAVNKPTMPVDFSVPLSRNAQTIDLVKHNAHLTDQLFRDTTQRVWYAEE